MQRKLNKKEFLQEFNKLAKEQALDPNWIEYVNHGEINSFVMLCLFPKMNKHPEIQQPISPQEAIYVLKILNFNKNFNFEFSKSELSPQIKNRNEEELTKLFLDKFIAVYQSLNPELIELYNTLQLEQQKLTKLLNNQQNIPTSIIDEAKELINSIDNAYEASNTNPEKRIYAYIQTLRSSQILIKTYSSFYNEGFLKGVLEYAAEGGRLDEVSKYLDFLTKQIEQWINNPPEDSEYAKKIVNDIKSSYIFKKYERLKPIKAKLSYMQALIHQHGLMGADKNIKQAIASFNDSALNGNREAYVKLGDIKLENALIQNTNDQLSDRNDFILAIQYYEKANELGLPSLSNAIFMQYKHCLQFGNFKEASNCLSSLQNLFSSHHDTKFSISRDELQQEISHLDNLQKSFLDAMTIEAHYIKCQPLAIKDLENEFLKIKEKVSTEINPIIDYYHYLILSQKFRLMKNATTEEKQVIKKQIDRLTNKLLDVNNYPDSCKGKLYYIYGLALNDQIPVFKKSLNSSAKDYFIAAITKGFPLGYSYLANIAEMEKDDEKIYFYYQRGSLAGDPRCQLSFFHRYLHKKLKDSVEINDINNLISTAQEMLSILYAAKNNPYLVTKDYVNENILFVEKFLADNTYQRKELFPDFWIDKDKNIFSDLTNILEEYQKSQPMINEETLIYLYKINDIIHATLSPTNNLSDNDKKVLSKLVSDLDDTIEFLENILNKQKLNAYASLSKMERISKGIEYFSKNGHLDSSHYFEYIDPTHRMSSMLRSEWESSVFSNYSLIEFLQKQKNITKDIPEVMYLNKYQKEKILVKRDEESNNIVYQKTGTVLPDGKFLYVFDKDGKFYVADEKKSFSLRNKAFQHSSILSGDHVRCAGEITVKNGKIININNGSGHYIPTSRQLIQTIASLKKMKLINVDHPDFSVGVFGVSNIPNFSGNILKLNIDEFIQYFDSIVKVESENRDLNAFKALDNPNLAKIDIDPYAFDEYPCEEIIIAMNLQQNAKNILLQHQDNILSTQWSPGFFNETIVNVKGKSISLPNDKFKELQMIKAASITNNWVDCLVKLNLVNNESVKNLMVDKKNLTHDNKKTWKGFQ